MRTELPFLSLPGWLQIWSVEFAPWLQHILISPHFCIAYYSGLTIMGSNVPEKGALLKWEQHFELFCSALWLAENRPCTTMSAVRHDSGWIMVWGCFSSAVLNMVHSHPSIRKNNLASLRNTAIKALTITPTQLTVWVMCFY